MPAIPATPTFTTGSVASIASLSSLSTLAALGTQYQTAWKLYRASVQTASSGATTSISWTNAAWNPDSDWASGATVTIETAGYYALDLYLNTNPAGTTTITVWFTITHSGTTTSFGSASGSWAGNSGTVLAIGSVVPQLCQVGDTISAWILGATANVTLQAVGSGQAYNSPTSVDYLGIEDGGCWFTGRLLSIGGTP